MTTYNVIIVLGVFVVIFGFFALKVLDSIHNELVQIRIILENSIEV